MSSPLNFWSNFLSIRRSCSLTDIGCNVQRSPSDVLLLCFNFLSFVMVSRSLYDDAYEGNLAFSESWDSISTVASLAFWNCKLICSIWEDMIGMNGVHTSTGD
jgi:hypothetical protein